MTFDDAKRRITDYGTPFGAVLPVLAATDQDALRAWYVGESGVPNLKARRQQSGGNVCRCGGLLVRTGTCETCSSCGESSGGCG